MYFGTGREKVSACEFPTACVLDTSLMLDTQNLEEEERLFRLTCESMVTCGKLASRQEYVAEGHGEGEDTLPKATRKRGAKGTGVHTHRSHPHCTPATKPRA